MGKQRPPYPPEWYPILRREANFGCVKCGKPIVTIHHIEGYEGKHELKSVLMLCKKHHDLAIQCKITKSELYTLKKKPYNFNKVHHAFQIPAKQKMVVNIGGNKIIETPVALQLMKEPIISIRRELDQFLVSATFFDKYDNLRLKLMENVWDADTQLVDLRYSENEAGTKAWLSIKMEDSEPYLDFKIVNDEIYIFGKFYRRGTLFDVKQDGTFVLNKIVFMAENIIKRRKIGIKID